MILNDYICKACNYQFEALAKNEEKDAVKCRECGAQTTRKVCRTKDDWFRPFVSDDFNGSPIEVRTKEQYKSLCKEHNVYAPHAFGRGFNISEI